MEADGRSTPKWQPHERKKPTCECHPFGAMNREQASAAANQCDDVYLDNAGLYVHWDRAHQFVFSERRDFVDGEDFRAGLLTVIQAIKVNGAVAYMSDARRIKVILRDDREWVLNTWKPLAIEAGLKRMAVVVADGGMGKEIIEELIEPDDPDIQSRTFTSMEAAREWLLGGPAARVAP